MSQAPTGPKPRSKPRANVYTFMAFVAFVALGAAVGFIWWKSVEITKPDQPNQGKNPFFIVKLNRPPLAPVSTTTEDWLTTVRSERPALRTDPAESTSGTTPAPGGTTPAPGGTTPAPGGTTTPAPGTTP